VVSSSLLLLGAQLEHHGLEVALHLAEDLPPVLANPFSLEEVVINLLVNARDAVEDRFEAEPDLAGPHVELVTRLDPQSEDRPVRIEVRDRGMGISDEIVEAIFDPFFTTKGPQRGTGLGLSIARAIIEDFDGRIDIQSKRGEGTVATISLPAAAVPAWVE
jgi:histidine kinase